MRVKKFEAKNMKDALRMVKNELGPDAVILSARDNRKSFGIGGEPSVEVTAAVSESTLHRKHFVESRMTNQTREKFKASDARTQRQIINRMVDSRPQPRKEEEEKPRRPITTTNYIDIHDEEIERGPRRTAAFNRASGRNVRDLLNDFERGFDNQAREATPASRQAPSPAPVSASPSTSGPASGVSEGALSRIRDAAREAWRAGLSTVGSNPSLTPAGDLESVAGKATEPAVQSEEIASLKSEIDRLQQMLEGFQKVPQSFVTMHPGAEQGIPYDLSFMFQKLIEAGITPENTIEILHAAAKAIDPVQMKKRPIVDAWVARWFLDRIHTVSHPFSGRIHLFVGGSGSGKTSALIKMASHFVVREKKKIAVLTTDSFKVGAVDQLKIYCQILNVPFAVIRSRVDWEWVLGQLANIDHVLVDFPGFQLKELEEIHVLKSLLPPSEAGATCHLCMSATAKDGDAFEVARKYKVTDYSDLIFTNLDQSVQHGIIYNLQSKTGKPLHSFGIGSRIPEDFEAASKERVLDLIFKLTRLRRETK